MRIVACILAFYTSIAAADIEPAKLSGKITEVAQPNIIWIGALELHLRDAFLLEEKRKDALAFMRSLANNRQVECRLSGERLHKPDGPLVANCKIFGPTDGRAIDLSARLIEQGFARQCEEPAAMIAVWPPVYACN